MLQRFVYILALLSTFCWSPLVFAQGALQPRSLSPEEFLLTDTANTSDRTAVPGMVTLRTTIEQDSAYKLALATNLPTHLRFAMSLAETSAFLRFRTESPRRPTIWDQINTTMNIPREILQPTAQERTQYQLTIANAMYVPGVLLWPMGVNSGNAQISFADIARVFGIGEDTGPEIRYVVDETIEVEILVYSTQAIIVRQAFRGIQAPGAYTVTWDGRDGGGKTAGPGEYIAEVRLGSDRIMRKRISWKGR